MWQFQLGIPITWDLILLVLVGIIGRSIAERFTCLAYGVSWIYFFDQLLILLRIKSECFELPYARLILLVGVLHIIEGILTTCFGARDNTCIVAYKEDELAGGYQSYRRWYIPLFLFVLEGFYLPILVGLIFVSETFTMKPEQKAKKVGVSILIYGLMLSIAGYLAEQGELPTVLIMLAMPLLHDILLSLEDRLERKKLLYDYPSKGIRILEVTQGNTYFNRGDIILSINGKGLRELDEYQANINESDERIHLEICNMEGKKKHLICSKEELKGANLVILSRK